MKFKVFGLVAALLFAVPSFAEEKGTLGRVYEGALKAAEKVFGPEERPHKVDKNKQPQIIIEGGELRYNGRHLKLGDTFANWTKVLGKPTRFNGRRIYTWDNLGINVWLQDKDGPGYTGKITEMNIYLNFKARDTYMDNIATWPDGTPVKKEPDFRPKTAFPGYLEIDGAGVDRTSKVWEVNWNKNMFGDPVRHGFQRAHLPTIYSAVTPPPEFLMTFDTDEKGRDGVIYVFGVNKANITSK